MKILQEVDWSGLPVPIDDGSADHLAGMALPDVGLVSTTGGIINLLALKGRTVIYAYPRTGLPGVAPLDGWDAIPGARGCTPQSCAFRDHHADLMALGVQHLFGLSTQTTEYQREAAERLHLPFALLSDTDLRLTHAMGLPTFNIQGLTLLKRLTLICKDGQVEQVFYPVFPPDRSPVEVEDWLNKQSTFERDR